jgi:phospholipase/lecithinase/hemolysin
LVTDVKNFAAPSNVANDLFVVWVCNADTFDTASALLYNSSYPYINANLQSQTNHLQIITNLYAKGVRTLIMPNAVDISKIPAFNAGTVAPTLHAECVDYNTRFSNTIAKARALCPGLTIYTPDFFTLLNNVLTNAANYGLTNALSYKGLSIDALTVLYATQPVQLNGPGTNYVFWDSQDPTAQFHEVIADVVQQIISPVQVGQITALNGSNQMMVANMPVGLNGFVDATTNMTQPSWTVVQNITSTSTTQSVFVAQPPTTTSTNVSGAFAGGGTGAKPADSGLDLLGGPPPNYIALEFYRLRFPYAWSWP